MRMLAFCCLWLLAQTPCAGAAETIATGPDVATELWQGRVLTASFKAGMCFSPDGSARGVLLLKHANGEVDEYHLYGKIKNNEFELAHSSGHVFRGKLVSPGQMEGRVKLKNSISLSLKGTRQLDIPLLAADCAPLPQ